MGVLWWVTFVGMLLTMIGNVIAWWNWKRAEKNLKRVADWMAGRGPQP